MSFSSRGDAGRPPGTVLMDTDGFVFPPKRKRGRPRKVRDDDNASIATASSFGTLTDDDQGESNLMTKKFHGTKPKRPPPITIKSIEPKVLEENLKDVAINRQNIKIRMKLDGGANVYVTTNDEFRAIRAHLDAKSVKYFTYTPDDEKLKRYVLYGLPEHDTKDIKEYIKNTIKVEPHDVRKMRIAKPRYQGHANYVVYFDKKSDTSLLLMKQISGMFGYHVFWSHYRRTEMPQCYNCQSFFHTSRGCTLTSRCNRCGGKHKSSDCSLVDKETNKVPDDKVKCCLCGGNHTSSYRQCPKRLQKIQQHQEEVERQRHTRARNRYVQNYQNYDCNYPQLQNVKVNNVNNGRISNAWETPLQSHANVRSNSDSFTPKQLFQIFNEMLRICSTYKTKMEQLSALSAVVEKYVIHD